MRNLIPSFISEKIKKKENRGYFEAAVLFLDISGFTLLTESLMSHGKEGAEILSASVNAIFEPLIGEIQNHRGFISSFAGDAFTAIFQNEEGKLNAMRCAYEMMGVFKRRGLRRSKFGEFQLYSKIGLSFGLVEWGIVGNGGLKACFFRGEAILNSYKSEKKAEKSEIIFDKSFLIENEIEKILFSKRSENYYVLLKYEDKQHEESRSAPYIIPTEVLKLFFSGSILELKQKGEFREVVSVFISFEISESFNKINQFVSEIIEISQKYNGYFNRLEIGDKGPLILILFGAPKAFENNLSRALDFILDVKKEFKEKIKAGLTSAVAYAGFIGCDERCEYTAFGDEVNQAVRLMSKARWGEILVNEKTVKKVSPLYFFENLGMFFLKGKSSPVKVYSLIHKKDVPKAGIFHNKMLGREKEVSKIEKIFKCVLKDNTGGIVSILGDAGIGKTRLIQEIIHTRGSGFNVFILQSDSILRQSLNPFKSFLNDYFYSKNKNRENKKQMFQTTWELFLRKLDFVLNPEAISLKKELERTTSIIGSLIGLHWQNSLFEKLDPRGRFENLEIALTTFFTAQSILKPLILLFEDIHWIDEDSKIILRRIASKTLNYPILIFTTSRLDDFGQKIDIDIDKSLSIDEILIKKLSRKAEIGLTKEFLGGKPNIKLSNYISENSAGNPFYIEHLCAYLEERELIIRKGDMLSLKEDKIVDIPIGINSIIVARIDRLSMKMKEAIQVASVLGMEIDKKVFSEFYKILTDITEGEIEIIISDGEYEQIWKKLHVNSYVFAHALLREAAYQMQLESRLKELHKLAGDVIRKMFPDVSEKFPEIAYHYLKGEIFEKAKYYLIQSADNFRQNYRNKEAIEYYDKALVLLTRPEDDYEKKEIFFNKASIFNFTGNWKDAMSNFEEALVISRLKKDHEGIVNSLIGIAYLVFEMGDPQKAKNIFEESIKISRQSNYKKGESEALTRLGVVNMIQGNFEKALNLYHEALKSVSVIDDLQNYSNLLGNIGTIYSRKGNYLQAKKYYEKKIGINKKMRDKNGLASVFGNIGNDYANQGFYEKAMKFYKAQLRISEQVGNRIFSAKAYAGMGRLCFETGKFDEALNHFSKEKRLCDDVGEKRGSSIALGNMGLIYKKKGEYDKAMKCYNEHLKISQLLGNRESVAIVLSRIAGIFHEKNEKEKAIEFIDRAIEIGVELGIKYYLCTFFDTKASILYEMGKIEEAKKYNKEALQISQEIGKKNIIFSSFLLRHKIDKNTEALKEMLLEKEISEENRAKIFYEVWQLTGKEEFRIKALETFEMISAGNPDVSQKKIIKKLLRLD